MAQVQTGDKVRMHYTGQLENGAVFGSTYEAEPVEFTAGGNDMLAGISKAVVGMEEGEKKSITLNPEDGFGTRQDGLQQQVPRNALPEEAKVGDRFMAQAGEQQIPVWVRELGEETAVVDGNHPLAGQTLKFDIELVGITSSEGE